MASEKPLKYVRKRRIAETPVDDDAVRSPEPRKDATRHGEDESATKPRPVSEINFEEKLKSITKKMEAMEAKVKRLEEEIDSMILAEARARKLPRFLFRGFSWQSGGALKGLNGQDGVIPHGFLGGKTPSNMYDEKDLRDQIHGHLSGWNVNTHFSSWAADFRTAAAYAIRPNSYMAIMDTSLVENHVSVYHVPDLYHAGLSGAWFPHEYLVYGPITGPAYHCVEWSDIAPLLAGTKPRYQDALSGNQYSQEQVDLAKQLAMQFRRQLEMGDGVPGLVNPNTFTEDFPSLHQAVQVMLNLENRSRRAREKRTSDPPTRNHQVIKLHSCIVVQVISTGLWIWCGVGQDPENGYQLSRPTPGSLADPAIKQRCQRSHGRRMRWSIRSFQIVYLVYLKRTVAAGAWRASHYRIWQSLQRNMRHRRVGWALDSAQKGFRINREYPGKNVQPMEGCSSAGRHSEFRFLWPAIRTIIIIIITVDHEPTGKMAKSKMEKLEKLKPVRTGHKDNAHGIPTYWSKSGSTLQKYITALATTDFLLFGYDQGVMAGIISSPAFVSDFPEVDGDSTWQGFITSIYAVGCFLGASFILTFGDRLGRRYSIFLGAAVMIIGVIIQIASVPPGAGATAQFIIGRCITGIGNGINTSTVPTYQAECSPAHNRGKLICIEGGNVAVGTLVAYWIDYGCTYGPHAFVWRFPIAFQIAFALVILVLMLRLPESPRWLLSHGREEEANTVLAALADKHREHEEVQGQITVINDAIRAAGMASGNTSMKELFTNGRTQHLRRLLLGAGSQMMQQLSGCNAVIYYFPILFQTSIGTTENLALLLGGINMVVYALFACTSWYAVERLGRRKLFFIGTIGQCLSMVLVFGALIPGTASAGKGAGVGLFTYIAFFGATWLPLPWLYPAEINPLKTRAKANATSTVSNWLWNFFIVMITPVLIDSIGWGTYLFFAALNAIFLPILYFYYPETSGRSLEEIDIIFAKGHDEKISYVKAAKELPKLTADEVREYALKYHVNSSDDETGELGRGSAEKENQASNIDNANALMS
ncbi:putative Major facilitator superfamily (MFS) profile domain-containing protein [Seiridium unicorne]|uniref:Major facilitator superfamily (MFS) profile domain-containing protein n=1 Tax=Seiridium unicorne TaxID=138068 RepID=A0ABR2UFI8_9PEZI